MFAGNSRRWDARIAAKVGDEPPLNQDGFRFKYMVFLFKNAASILRLNLIVDESSVSSNSQTPSMSGQSVLNLRKSSSAKRKLRLPDYFLIAYVWSNIHSLVFLNFQYKYDYNLWLLERLVKQLPGSYGNLTVDQILNQSLPVSFDANLMSQINEIKTSSENNCYFVSLVSGSCEQMNFHLELVWIIFIFGGLMGYAFNMMIYRNKPFYCHSVQDLCDYELEQMRTNNLVLNLVDELDRSRETFYKCLSEQRKLEQGTRPLRQGMNRMWRFAPNRLGPIKLTGLFSWDPVNSTRHLMSQLLVSGAFWPLNKTVKWIDSRLNFQFKAYCFMLLFNFALCLLIICSITFTLGGNRQRRQTLGQFLTSQMINLDLAIIIFSALISYTFYSTSSMLNAIDLVKLANRNHTMLINCIKMNTTLHYVREGNKPTGEVSKQMNRNLMLFLVHYKILVVQLSQGITKPSLVFISVLISMMLASVTIRLHSPYTPDNDASQIFAVAMLFIVLQSSDMVLIPICHLHSCCMQLYKSLNRLLAHTIELNEARKTVNGKDNLLTTPVIYDEHMISLLRKELENPYKAKRRFEARIFGVSCTYSTICKAHFWFGLIFISAIIGKHSSNKQLFNMLMFRM